MKAQKCVQPYLRFVKKKHCVVGFGNLLFFGWVHFPIHQTSNIRVLGSDGIVVCYKLWLCVILVLTLINLSAMLLCCKAELTNSIVNGIGIGFLSCIGIGIGIVKTQSPSIGIGIVKTIPKVLVITHI